MYLKKSHSRLIFACSLGLWLISVGVHAQTGMVGTLQWTANRAKAAGQSTYTFGPVLENFDYTPKLAQVVNDDLLVSGMVESSFVEAVPTSFNIQTWYKIKVQMRGPEPSAKNRLMGDAKIPDVLQPLASDEVIVCVLGGTAEIEGVTLTQIVDPPLTLGKRYLLFLEPMTTGAAYHIGFMTTPVLVDERGKIEHPDKVTPFLRSIDWVHDVEELKRYVKTTQH